MSEQMRNIGIVDVSMDLLGQMLHFPEGHRIIDARGRRNGFGGYGSFEILVEGPSLPQSKFMESTPRIDYLITVKTDANEMVAQKTFEGKFTARSTAPTSDEAAV